MQIAAQLFDLGDAMKISSFVASALVVLVIVLTPGAAVSAAEVKVWAGGVFRETINKIGPRFERATGHKLAVEFAASPVFLKRIEVGENFDVAILVPATIDGWIKDGRIVADTRTNIGRASLGVASRADATKPDVSSSDALKRALLGANAVSYFPGGAVGKHFASVLDRLEIAAAMKLKLRPVKAGGASPASVAKGEADLAIAFIPAILGTPGVALAGSFPLQLALHVDLVAGVGTATKEPGAGRALVAFLVSPEGAAAIRAAGLEPIAP